MAFVKYATSGVVNAATVSTTPGSPTTVLAAERQALCLMVDNGSNQPLFLSFGDNTGDDATILPGRAFVIDCAILGRKIEPVIKARMGAAATGNITVNVLM